MSYLQDTLSLFLYTPEEGSAGPFEGKARIWKPSFSGLLQPFPYSILIQFWFQPAPSKCLLEEYFKLSLIVGIGSPLASFMLLLHIVAARSGRTCMAPRRTPSTRRSKAMRIQNEAGDQKPRNGSAVNHTAARMTRRSAPVCEQPPPSRGEHVYCT